MIPQPFTQIKILCLIVLLLSIITKYKEFQQKIPTYNYIQSDQQIYRQDVQTQKRQLCAVRDLKQYDIIFTLNHLGELTKDLFIGFLYVNNSQIKKDILKFSLTNNIHIYVSSEQLLGNCATNFIIYQQASSLKLGDKLCLHNNNLNFLGLATILSITNKKVTEVVQLMTVSGTLLVNNISMSAQQKYNPFILSCLNSPYILYRREFGIDSQLEDSYYLQVVMYLLDQLPSLLQNTLIN